MPRGREGLLLIEPARVRKAFKRWYSWRADGPTHIAAIWLVSERTIRRWQKTGLPTCYGSVWITPQQWEEFERTGKCPRATTPPIAAPAKNEKVSVSSRSTRSRRTAVDRDASKPVRPIGRTGAVKWWPMRGPR